MIYENTPITVAEMIDKLSKLPQDAKIVVSNWDSEYGMTHYTHVYDTYLGSHKDKPVVYIHDGLCQEDWAKDDEDNYTDIDEYEE